jgi:hypothetical protein
MKKIILTLSVLFFTLLSFSQGIAIQGLARDVNNTARLNTNVALIFEIYYLNASNAHEVIFTDTPTLLTDSFGVFSHVLNIPNETESEFSNRELYLKISEGTTPISDELFKRVPLAYSASNGVPTGSIMPFIGTTAPTGWILCNGGAIAVNSNTAMLRALLGSPNAPDLQGMFLRGTGVNPVNSKSGPSLKETQMEAFKVHTHDNNFAIGNGGTHSHKYYDRDIDETTGFGDYADGDGTGGRDPQRETNRDGSHTHTLKGGIFGNGGDETRPVNYGVNYIIKL